jgi:hypothetical protein
MQETVPRDVESTYRALTGPLLVVQGEADAMFDPEQMSAFMLKFV